MNARADFYTASKEAVSAMIALEKAGSGLGIDPRLLDLIKLRASQINGCAFCMDLHTSDARKAGESERRLATVSAWRETPFFTERERAALAWTESLTNIAQTHAPDADYDILAAQFSAKEMADLTLAIVTINAWNRFAIGFRKMPAA
ncbi:alkylhydroperoxidase [Massilia sp. WF1]|uniref:carboxymuconolactone decarboxylase family protein n=1 Tax=unclassified Massilia TaxID=2609279 RepID=UPI00064A1EF9|nr:MULTISPECIES: carboxymuconolactone decarboxylase family protein [unclassified Massilia]ALK97941.1 alkylhydroperoxidase [Massilia sp. WG5]KLU36959.1 alkylhydroperoxidase [Massilia sp. WF1]